MKRAILLLPLLGMVSACQPPVTRDQELAFYRSRCMDYGFELGTVEFANCMKEQEAHEEKLAIQARKAQAREDKNWIEQQKVRVKEREVATKILSQ